jgi:hypothetical protein
MQAQPDGVQVTPKDSEGPAETERALCYPHPQSSLNQGMKEFSDLLPKLDPSPGCTRMKGVKTEADKDWPHRPH